MRRVVVTGLGAVTPLGVGVQRTWTRLLAGDCGIVSTRHLGDEFAQLPSQVAGLVPLGRMEEGGWDASEHVTKDERHKTALFTQYALAATTEALHHANWHPKPTDTHALNRTGVTLGTGIGNLHEQHATSLAYASPSSSPSTSSSGSGSSAGQYKKIHPLFVPRLLPNLAAGHISMRHSFRGPNHCASTACTTGAHSLGDAMRFIQHGAADVMLAGSAESCVHPLALGGFARARSLAARYNEDPRESSRPWDRGRDGFVVGEGAGVVVLEELQHALSRGVGILAELVGYGATADAWHVTRPPEDGGGALRAMRMAVDEARNEEGDEIEVDYINAHATGTGIGDVAEGRAIAALVSGSNSAAGGGGAVGEKRRKPVLVSSTKGALGHLLGGAGSVEAIVAIMALHSGRVPGTVNLVDLDEQLIRDEVEGRVRYVRAPRVEEREEDEGRYDIKVALSNSFGFGGTNACLCFRRWEGK